MTRTHIQRERFRTEDKCGSRRDAARNGGSIAGHVPLSRSHIWLQGVRDPADAFQPWRASRLEVVGSFLGNRSVLGFSLVFRGCGWVGLGLRGLGIFGAAFGGFAVAFAPGGLVFLLLFLVFLAAFAVVFFQVGAFFGGVEEGWPWGS